MTAHNTKSRNCQEAFMNLFYFLLVRDILNLRHNFIWL
nr:MAG TPA: hypothetical protein [Caudoviricetes sp.]